MVAMSDSYQAIYDAVRSRITGGNVGDIVESVLFRQFDISHTQAMLRDLIAGVIYDYGTPAAIYRPSLSIDGRQWCALYGVNLQEGVAGFGDSPAEALDDFNKAWTRKLPAITAADEINGIRSDLSKIMSEERREEAVENGQFGVGA